MISKPFKFSHIYSIIDYVLDKEGREQEVRNRRHSARTSDKVTLKFQPTGENVRYKAPADNISITGAQLTRGDELAKSDTLDMEIHESLRFIDKLPQHMGVLPFPAKTGHSRFFLANKNHTQSWSF